MRPFDAMTDAFTRVRQVLFSPFDPMKYLILGFCMWLALIGSVSGSAPSATARWDAGSAGRSSPAEWDPTTSPELMEAMAWLRDWGALIGLVVGVLAIVGIAVWVLVLFLQTRGTFMVIDGIVRNRGAVREPWTELAEEANSLFRLRLAVNLGAGLIGVVALSIAAYVVLMSWTGWPLTAGQLALAATAAVITGLAAAFAGFLDACANEFVAPLMYARRYTVGPGFRDLLSAFREHVGAFLAYALLRIVAALGVAAVAGALACLTCGLAMLPFVGTLILLPALVFVRSFSLDFVAQLDDDLRAALQPEADA